MPDKPHITPWRGFYRCDGSGASGFGITGPSAYWQWLAMLPKAMKPWIEDKRFYPAPPSAQDAAMLEALRSWEPTQAH